MVTSVLMMDSEQRRPGGQALLSLLDRVPVALVLLEPSTGRILFANREADRLAGGTFPRSVDSEAFAFDGPSGRKLETHELPTVRAARGEVLAGLQVVWDTPKGQRHILVSSERVTPEGESETIVLAFDDVTRLKQVEGALTEAVEARDQFLSVVSHELKTPLTTLKLHTQSLLRSARNNLTERLLPERLLTKAESLERNVDRLDRLINQLLDISRIRGGRLVLDPEPCDLAELAREVALRFADELAREGCPLTIVADEPVRGVYDRARIDQVITNLLSNAIKYGGSKPIELVVTASDADPPRAILSVRDHGIGISKEHRDRIFERFERAVIERTFGGLGLGLWIVRRVVEAHGGTIELESTPGKGSLFTVKLPPSFS